MTEEQNIEVSAVSTLEFSILKVLSYAHVFKYPLNKHEIVWGLDIPFSDPALLDQTLTKMEREGIIHVCGNFFSLISDNRMEERRLDLNKRAKKYLKIAHRMSRFIGNFPFVRAVFLSGSITKNSMAKDSDIDYFIITEPGRLWFARTVLIAFKKIFLLNSYKLFCLNYFVDSNNLKIQDQNLYVAHEIATLIPTYGIQKCESFIASNRWIQEYLPNADKIDVSVAVKGRIRGLKWMLEKLLNGKVGHYLDRKFKSITENYWSKKFDNLKGNVQSDYFVSKATISALHPDNFKLRILRRYHEILKEQEERLNYRLD